jgi:hypothetical protein
MAFSSNPTRADLRHSELLALLEQQHPESKALLDELSNLIGDLWCEAETAAVVHHGEQILAVIEGRGYAGRGNTSDYEETIGLGQAATRLEELETEVWGPRSPVMAS